MRHITNINRKWAFSKEATEVPASLDKKWNFVNLPHSWNAIDGQDGDSDYYRGTAYYVHELDKELLPEADRYYIEICGANSSADVYLDGKHLAHHDGGYSTWRVDITEELTDNTEIDIHTDYYKPETQYKAKSIACEYLDGKLVNIKSGNPFTVKTTLHNSD